LLLRKVDPVVHFREEEIHDQGEWQNEQQTDKGEFPRILQAVHDRNGGGEQHTPGLLLRPLLSGKRGHGLTSRSSGLLLFFPDATPLMPEKSRGNKLSVLPGLSTRLRVREYPMNITHLSCSSCGAQYEPGKLYNLCHTCGKPLLVHYD